MSILQTTSKLSADDLREDVNNEYAIVALDPHKGYHFHTGRATADRPGYDKSLYAGLPEENTASFAGTGNPIILGLIELGEIVVDVGSSFDSLIASALVGPEGQVIGVDMTQEMLNKARVGAEAMGATHVEFREGFAENLPLPKEYADVPNPSSALEFEAQGLRLRARKPFGK